MLISKVNISIVNQDWQPLIEKHQYVNGLLKDKPAKDPINARDRYFFGNSGGFWFYDTITETPRTAGSMIGNFVETLLPWTEQVKKDLAPINLTSIAFQGNKGPLIKHVDGGEMDDPTKHCKINYVIDNYNAVTYAEDKGVVKFYPSVKDTAWLLDTTKTHWVEGTGQRYIFQLGFHEYYDNVLEYLNSLGGLTYDASK